MLRTALLVLAISASPSLAAAEDFADSALHLEVRGDDGTVMSRVESVERNAEGRVMAVDAPGLEPADAPADAQLVAQNDSDHFFISYSRAERNDPAQRSAGGSPTRAR